MSEEFLSEVLYKQDLGMPFMALVLGVSFVLGAIHALGPGHGKSLMAAYLVGSRGKIKDAVILSLTITISHVFIVIVIGFIALYVMDFFWSEKASVWLSLVSGIMIIFIGIWLLLKRWGKRPHSHSHPLKLDDKNHSHQHFNPNISVWSNISLGISSGIVPCPKALVILLLAISLQKLTLGLAIISVFSLGLGTVLVFLGIVLVKASHLVQNRLENRWIQYLPIAGSVVIIALGCFLTFQMTLLL